MFKCIYSKKMCTSSTEEHILQNIFGGARTSATIVSNECQQIFAEGIDTVVANQMNPFRNLIDTRSGRGKYAPPIENVTSSTGGEYELNHGGKPHLCKPSVSAEECGEKIVVNATVSDSSQLGWVDALVRERYPGSCRIETIRQPEGQEAKETFSFNIHVAGKDFTRGILKSCFNLVGCVDPEFALTPVFDPLREFILNGNGDVSNFGSLYCPPGKLGIEDFGPFSHVLCAYPKNGRLCAYTRFWGEIGFMFSLCKNYQGDFCVAYHLDPTRIHRPRERIDKTFDYSSLPAFDVDRSADTIQKGMAAMRTMYSRFDFHRRTFEISGHALKEVCNKRGLSAITLNDREAIDELAGHIAHDMISEFGRHSES